MNKEVFIKNRERLIKKLDDNSIAILFAGEAPKKSADEKYSFTPNRNFYYLTGIAEEKHILFISKIDGEVTEKMFIKEIDLEMEKWLGKTIRKEEVFETNGIKEIGYLGELNQFLNRFINSKDEVKLYLDLERDTYESLPTIASTYAKRVKNKYAHVQVKNIFPLFASLRLVKSDEEIAEMRKAIEITIKGLHSVMKNLKPGLKEYEMEAYFEFECRRNGSKDYAFKTIAAAGKNAATLHYVDNDDTLKDGDLMLFDLGAQWKYYNGDISRTFPINGKFTERQKAIYEAVLNVNEKIIEAIKPGVSFIEINNMANDLLAEACLSLGVTKKKEDFRKYYFHSIGHSLGLDTHDIDNPGRKTILEPGMVYTVEPGLYIPEEGIGIRIEDDVLVTENGREVLTKDMIKSVKDIENFMKK